MICTWSWPSSSGLRGRRRTYHTILKLAEHALSKMVRYVLLHSGSISSKHPDINFFFFFFFSLYMLVVIYVMTFLREIFYFSHKMAKIGPWRSLRILVCKSRFLPFLPASEALRVYFYFVVLLLLVVVVVFLVVRIDVSQIKAFLVNLTPPSTF
jgi:hypothetical protein